MNNDVAFQNCSWITVRIVVVYVSNYGLLAQALVHTPVPNYDPSFCCNGFDQWFKAVLVSSQLTWQRLYSNVHDDDKFLPCESFGLYLPTFRLTVTFLDKSSSSDFANWCSRRMRALFSPHISRVRRWTLAGSSRVSIDPWNDM